MTRDNTAPAATTGVWSAEVRRADDGLDALAAEWDDLVARCAVATPFQTYAWVEAWWRVYGKPGRLRLALVRRDGRLVAAAPMTLVRRGGVAVLTPLGGAFSDFTDVLVDDTEAPQALGMLTDVLIRTRGWQAIDFPETRPRAVAATSLRDSWPGAIRDLPASLCLELPARPMEEFVRDLPSHSRKTVRRRINQLAKSGVDIRRVPAADAGRGIADLLLLHAEQWRGRGVNPAHLAPAYAAHLSRAIRAMIAAEQAVLFEYRFDDRLLASSLVLVGRDLVGGYLFGADPELRDKVDVTTMLLADTLPLADTLGLEVMSMLRGAEEHKMRWRPEESRNRRILLARPGSPRGRAYLRGVLTYRAAVELAKERAPWLRTVRDRLRRPR